MNAFVGISETVLSCIIIMKSFVFNTNMINNTTRITKTKTY